MKKFILIFGTAFLLLFAPLLIHADELFIGVDEFAPMSSEILYKTALGGIETGLVAQSGSATALFSAPIQLPHGSKITAYTVFYVDNSASGLWFHMFRARHYASPWAWNSIFPSWTTTGASATKQIVKKTDVNWAYNEVRNDSATYHIYVQFNSAEEGNNLIFYGVKIFYKPPTTP